MKYDCTIMKTAFCVAIILALGTATGTAQVRAREGDGRTQLKVRELTGYGLKSLIKSPTSGASRRAALSQWVELGVQYDTAAEWLDEVTFQYYVLLRSKMAPVTYTLLKGSVTYVDVARGSAHLGVAYVRPAALLRYGDVVGVAVEAKIKGETVSDLSEGRQGPNKPLPSEWWKDPDLSPKEGYIIDKSKSPFALVNFDDYEALK